MFFYKSILQIPENQKFFNKINSYTVNENYLDNADKVLCCIKLFYKKYLEVCWQ